MSIILKGIDMPNGPIKLVLYPSGKVDEYVFNERIATDYQAIQIPTPHGDIKDIDTVDTWGWERPCEQSLENAPTILEAEEE